MRRLLTILCAFALLWCMTGVANAAFTFDCTVGTNCGLGGFNSTNTGSTSTGLTTANTNDIIVVVVSVEALTAQQGLCTGSACTVSSVTASGLTFYKRKASAFTAASFGLDVEEWWAYSAGAQTALSITVTVTGTSDGVAFVAFGVNNGYTSACTSINTPFDANVSLPAVAQNNSATIITPTVTGVSTTASATMLLNFLGEQYSTSAAAAGGFTIGPQFYENATVNQSLAVSEYLAVASPQSSISMAFAAGAQYWIDIGDALAPSCAGGASPKASFYWLL